MTARRPLIQESAVRPADRASLSRRGFLGLGAGVGAALLLGGCGDDAASTPRSASGSASASALEPYTVRTCVYSKNHASSALYWSQFAPEGITVEVVPVKSATEVQDGLESGQLDFGLLAPYTPIIALEKDPKLITSRIVGMISRGGLGLVGKKGVVDSVADLRGKKIAVPPPTLQVLILNDVLREAGLELGKDVEAVPLGFADHVTAFARGDVDAFMGSEPPVTQAIVEADGVRLPEASQTPVGDFNTANWASAQVLEERPDVVRAVCRMQKDAAELLSPGGENDKARWKELLVDQFGFQEEVYQEVLDNVGARWEFDEKRVEQVMGAARMLQQQGGISTVPDVEQLFAREYWDV
jgi:NitT/TauT family transport system substrate-binding protein